MEGAGKVEVDLHAEAKRNSIERVSGMWERPKGFPQERCARCNLRVDVRGAFKASCRRSV